MNNIKNTGEDTNFNSPLGVGGSKRIVILGGGESGAGAAVLAKTKGFDVFVSDTSEIKSEYKALLDKYEISWEEKQHSELQILNADEVRSEEHTSELQSRQYLVC